MFLMKPIREIASPAVESLVYEIGLSLRGLPPIRGGGGGEAQGGQATETETTPPPEGGSAANGQGSSDAPAGSEQEDQQLTKEQLEQLPDWARESLTKANKEAASYRTKLREKENFIERVGGEERINDLQWRTTTSEGIKSLFEEMTNLDGIGDILGVEPEQLKSLIGGAQKEAQQQAIQQEAKTGEALSPEQVEKLVKESVEKAVSGVRQETQHSALRTTVTNHLTSKGYTDDWSFGLITQMAAKHQNDPDIDMDSADPMAPYVQALDRGIADFEEWKKEQLSASQQAYLQGKANDAEGSPRTATGSDSATGEQWDPADLSWDELTKEAQKRGYFSE